jgi:hypothetical protein
MVMTAFLNHLFHFSADENICIECDYSSYKFTTEKGKQAFEGLGGQMLR